MTSTDLLVRLAGTGDVAALADLYLAAREAAVPAMPPQLHSREEVVAHVAPRVEAGEVWVAEQHGAVVGTAELTWTWLEGLYVLPGRTGEGIGTLLLELAKSLRPAGFSLWVFESNQGARRFYRRHGLVELEHTDGSTNEERSPDLRMAWPGDDPVAFLRNQVDEVDDELAAVLARRAALTAAIQRYKPVAGHAGRDADREQQIAERMAARAPGLQVEAWRRIMHEVITVSLDAAEPR